MKGAEFDALTPSSLWAKISPFFVQPNDEEREYFKLIHRFNARISLSSYADFARTYYEVSPAYLKSLTPSEGRRFSIYISQALPTYSERVKIWDEENRRRDQIKGRGMAQDAEALEHYKTYLTKSESWLDDEVKKVAKRNWIFRIDYGFKRAHDAEAAAKNVAEKLQKALRKKNFLGYFIVGVIDEKLLEKPEAMTLEKMRDHREHDRNLPSGA